MTKSHKAMMPGRSRPKWHGAGSGPRTLKVLRRALCAVVVASLGACGSGSSGTAASTVSTPAAQTSQLAMIVSDASSADWATIGVEILSLSLTPQGGGSPVTVYTAPATPPMINLEQLDQIGEVLDNAAVPVGTYTGATVTVAANPGDVDLVVSPEPDAGFAGTPGETIPASDIQIVGAQGSSGNLTVPVPVSFDSPLVVSASGSNALDLEFDLSHPAFIVAHDPPGATATQWAVNFMGPVRRRPISDITHLVLREMYGDVTAVAADGSSIAITKEMPTLPVVNPETPVSTGESLTIEADASNGTIFYDVDAGTSTTITSFSSVASSLAGRYVRLTARYQEDGSLVAVRVWASSDFNRLWLSPEGHVLHVDASTDTIVVANAAGIAVPITVDSATQFYFRQPADPAADAAPIGTGPTFLADHDLVRGFKVQVSVVDPLASPLVAQSVDIETAAYSGQISNALPDGAGFTYTHDFPTAADDYSVTLDYIASTSPNGKDPSGNTIDGFKWWDFAYPTQVNDGASAISGFSAAVGGGSSSGFTFAGGSFYAWGFSGARWGDPADPTGWAVPWTILLPTPLPRALVASGLANDSFTITLKGGTTPGTVDISTASGAATLVYQVDRSSGTVSISPIDITSASGLSTLSGALIAGTPVKVYGTPQPDGTLRAYALLYFTGTQPGA
ncbi:MAG TPA: DUF4382 domain-containing protein [Steroidobacteraceae bacterium]|nr:DUF4382 domain-containing protein [Steroidobacteraceae bacterium]